MINRAVFLGSKKFGLNLFKALYEADSTVSWTVLCPPDLNDTRTYFSEFQEYAKMNKLGFWNMKFEYPWIWKEKIRKNK